MSSKSIGVAYTPSSKDIPIEAPQKIDTPQYPDAGISYAGFSKTLYAGNIFRLNPQQPIDWNITQTWGAGSTGAQFFGPTGILTEGKDFYVNKIIIGNYKQAAVGNNDTITLASGSDAKLVLRELQPTLIANFLLDFNFETPLKFKKGNTIVVQYSAARGAGDFLVLNMYGWAE